MSVTLNRGGFDHAKKLIEDGLGDFKDVHLCGVLAAESRAGQYKYGDIENAAAHLHGMLTAVQR